MSKKPALDLSREGRQRRSEAVDARMSASNLTGEARTSARRQIEAEVEQEEIAAAATATNKADAAAERSRIAAIVKAGRDRDRAQQALRLAILGPVNVAQAEGILPSLASDVDATDADKAVPGFMPFPGESAATANERRRIGSIFAHPSATGRFKAACALALAGEGDMPLEAAAALLSAIPAEAVKPRIPSIAERAEGMAEFGGDYSPRQSRSEATAEGWRKAVAAANASIGAGAMTAAGSAAAADLLAGLPGPDDPSFGTKAEYERIMEASRARLKGTMPQI